MPRSRIRWYSRSVSVIAGATVIESPVCTPIGSMFSIEQTTTALSCRSRISSSSYSFQPSTLSSISTACTGLAGQAGAGDAASRSSVGVRHAGTQAAHGEGRPDHHRQAQLGDGGADLVHRVADRGPGHVGVADREPALATMSLKICRSSPRLIAVDVGADQLDAVLLQHARLVQRDRGVQRGLPAQGGQHRVAGAPGRSTSFSTNSGGDRLDVGGVGELRVGHDRRRVGVDQARPGCPRSRSTRQAWVPE